MFVCATVLYSILNKQKPSVPSTSLQLRSLFKHYNSTVFTTADNFSKQVLIKGDSINFDTSQIYSGLIS